MYKSIELTSDLSVPSASIKLGLVAVCGVIAGLIAGLMLSWKFAPLVAWDVAALIFLATTWQRVLGFSPEIAKKHALREDPSRVTADVVLLVASVASLAAVGFVLIKPDGQAGGIMVAEAALGLSSVVVSWLMIHTIFTLKYAEMYYRSPHGAVDFGDTKTPTYADFAYLAFTIGMTYQVSDTSVKTRQFRRNLLQHALLSYLFGTIIIAATINLIAGLGH